MLELALLDGGGDVSAPSIKLDRESHVYTYGPITKCVACQGNHEAAIVVVQDDRVWYRCGRTLIFIRRVNVRL